MIEMVYAVPALLLAFAVGGTLAFIYEGRRLDREKAQRRQPAE